MNATKFSHHGLYENVLNTYIIAKFNTIFSGSTDIYIVCQDVCSRKNLEAVQ